MDGEGYIRLYWKTKRSLVGGSAIGLGLWCHILLSVAVKRKLLWNGDTLEPGECIISLADLAKSEGVNRKQLDRYLRALESDGMITVTKRDRNGTKLSVCNFKTYQPQFFGSGTQTKRNGNETGTKRKSNGTQTESPKSKRIKRKGGSPFTPPTVEEVQERIDEMGYRLDAEAFVASNQTRGWKLKGGGQMVCWKSALVTWEKNRKKWDQDRQEQQRASRPKDVDLRF